jgi:hypothetical protein
MYLWDAFNMASSKAKTVEEYLAGLPGEKRAIISEVRKTILKTLPKGYIETMQYGMMAYVIPLETWPDTYNNQPLAIAALAMQKNYLSLYLMSVYGDPMLRDWFTAEYKASGKKLDMGKSCIRFKKLEDLPLDLIGKAIAKVSVDDYVRFFERNRPRDA